MKDQTVNKVLDVINVNDLRKDFPILNESVNGKPLIYFDNAATTQKPERVVNALLNYYDHYNANIHRGIHSLAEKATSAFEETRSTVRQFIRADEAEEIIFTYGTTDGINLVAATYGRANINAGDEIIISAMEHHSNIVPWQILCEEKKAKLKIIPVDGDGELKLDEFEKMISDRTKIVSVVHVSNSLGTINDIQQIIEIAHRHKAIVLIDGAQAAAHIDIDVKKLKCDFYVFSAHKLFGPTGVGILYGKRRLLENMPPYRGGGEMIKEVTFKKTTYNDIPYKFEAGTPNIADVVALKAAIEYLNQYEKSNVLMHEQQLLEYATKNIEQIPGIRIIGKAKNKIGVLSFVVENMHHFDIGMMLDARGIAVRTGHHCTQPLMDFYQIEGTIRASFSIYNTIAEVDYFVESLKQIIERWK